MEYYFCLLTAEEAKDPIKLGWAYTKTKESDYSYNGILTRCTPVWQDGWSLYDINITH